MQHHDSESPPYGKKEYASGKYPSNIVGKQNIAQQPTKLQDKSENLKLKREKLVNSFRFEYIFG